MTASNPAGAADGADTAAEIAALRAEVARLTAAAEARPAAGDDPAARIVHEAGALLVRAEGLIRAHPSMAVAIAAGLGFLAGLTAGGGRGGDGRPEP